MRLLALLIYAVMMIFALDEHLFTLISADYYGRLILHDLYYAMTRLRCICFQRSLSDFADVFYEIRHAAFGCAAFYEHASASRHARCFSDGLALRCRLMADS